MGDHPLSSGRDCFLQPEDLILSCDPCHPAWGWGGPVSGPSLSIPSLQNCGKFRFHTLFAAIKEDGLFVHTVNEYLFGAAMSEADLPLRRRSMGETDVVIAQRAGLSTVTGPCLLALQRLLGGSDPAGHV